MSAVAEETTRILPAEPGRFEKLRKILLGRPETIFATGTIIVFVCVVAGIFLVRAFFARRRN